MVNNPPKKPPLASHLSDTQWRPRAARIRYEIESAFREEGFGDPALIYEEEKRTSFASPKTGSSPSL
jgi:hypothetical protein